MLSAKHPVKILWNSAAGWEKGEETAQRVQEILSDGQAPAEFEQLQHGDDIIGKSRGFIDCGSEVLVAAGGDGTINAVASAVVNTNAILGVIPAGTLNHFARDLSIPLDPEQAAISIRDGREIVVDVGEVNGRIFINNSVLGLYPVYRAAREAYERRGLGSSKLGRFVAVVRAMFRVFWHLPHLRLHLKLDSGKAQEIETPFVLVANNEHDLENWNIGHRTSLSEGRLWVYVMRRCTRWSVLRYFASFLFKRFSRHDAFAVYRAQQARVDSRHKHIRVGVDGEIVKMKTPLEYRSLPQSLRVIAPANYQPEIE